MALDFKRKGSFRMHVMGDIPSIEASANNKIKSL